MDRDRHGRPPGPRPHRPDGFESGSDVATMCLLGYDPKVYHTGRAPLEAAAQHIPLSPTDWVFRCNLVTVVDGIMKDHSAGGISDAEAQRLIATSPTIKLPGFEFHTGVSYRNLLVYRGSEEFDVTTARRTKSPKSRSPNICRAAAAKSSAAIMDPRRRFSPITRSTKSAKNRPSIPPRRSGSGARATPRTCRNSPRNSASSAAA
jgi:2,3-bisphosphoglycerate-independent phosphoglycerate mutase